MEVVMKIRLKRRVEPIHHPTLSPNGDGHDETRHGDRLAVTTTQVLAKAQRRQYVIASGFADGRSEASPDSERNEPTGATLLRRVSVSMEQIQDSECEAIQPVETDVNRHGAAETNSCNYLVPECLTALVPCKHCAFTLAEVLITLAVIGIVAALTLPGLIRNHNEKAWSTAKDLWEKKLTETVRRMNVDGVMTGHDTTEDFMNSFKNYMKVIKTCDNGDINKCYSPKIVTTGKDDAPEEIETNGLTSASSMGLNEWQTNTNTMSFVVADGTTVIMAYQPECPYADPIEDTGSQVSCMAYMVDVNGKKGPNRVGKDIQLSSGVAFSTCDNPIGDMCWSTDFAPTAIDTCSDTTYDEHGTDNPYCATNYWAGAIKACKEKGMELPTLAQLAQLASEIYLKGGEAVHFDANTTFYSGLTVKDQYKNAFTFATYWSNEEACASHSYKREFDTTSSGYINSWASKSLEFARTICVSN